MIAPGVNPWAAEDAALSRYEPETGFGCALFDARNGFNEINRDGIGEADLPSTGTNTGSGAWSGQCWANKPL